MPPFKATGEFFKLDRLGFRVILPSLGQRLFVVPDFFSWMRAVEEEQIGRDARVGREDAVGEAISLPVWR